MEMHYTGHDATHLSEVLSGPIHISWALIPHLWHRSIFNLMGVWFILFLLLLLLKVSFFMPKVKMPIRRHIQLCLNWV